MSFFLTSLPTAMKGMFRKGIQGTKAIGCFYTIAFIIHTTTDIVPSSMVKPPSRVSVDGFDVQSFLTGCMGRRRQMMQKAEARLQMCSWSLQLCGYLAQLATTLWVPSALVGTTIDRLFPHHMESVHWHGLIHLIPFLWAVVKWLFNTAFNFIINCLVGLLAILVDLLLFTAVGDQGSGKCGRGNTRRKLSRRQAWQRETFECHGNRLLCTIIIQILHERSFRKTQ